MVKLKKNNSSPIVQSRSGTNSAIKDRIMKLNEYFNFNSKLYQGKKQYNNSVNKDSDQHSRLSKYNMVIERKNKTEVIKIGNKKFIFMANSKD